MLIVRQRSFIITWGAGGAQSPERHPQQQTAA
jgi:hypothetical protein